MLYILENSEFWNRICWSYSDRIWVSGLVAQWKSVFRTGFHFENF